MGKMNELSMTIEELRCCAKAILDIADRLEPKPVERQVTLDEVRKVLAEKSRDGFTKEIRELLLKHGANKLSEVNPSDYPALLSEVEELFNGQ